ncbi:chitobiase/beta-hexosaminidase C-terminal domain-containing protein [Agromyces sp. NPDC058484]|uniref:chitobiase/beta-hexosaminidase C-terminal domain-containing protein n=1 Tax=Agromyces sp. NPDC058484 TaxID=3346524 RepID=UPI00365CC24B
MVAVLVTTLGLTVAGEGAPVSADQPRRSVAEGITAAGGLLVDPAGRVWVSDSRRGFCRVAEPSGSTPGAIEASTCLGGTSDATQKGPTRPGAPALLDPTPQNVGSGDELALVPDAAANSSDVIRARWDAPSGTFRYTSTLTIFDGDLRPVAVSVGPDRKAYVVFERTRSVVRIVNATSSQPTLETVAFLGGNGARAIAAGPADASGRITVYVAEATRLTSFRPPLTGRSGAATTASYPIGAVARLQYDPATRVLYASTAAATSAGGDSVTRVVTQTGQVEANWAAGFTRIGGIAVRQGFVLAADDQGLITSPVQTGKGAVHLLGEIVPRITAGPTMADGSAAPDPTITNDPTPTFTVAVDGGASLQCAFDNANWAACTPGDVTASPALGDGEHRFAVRIGASGTPIERTFTVDTTAPPTPVISSPAADGQTLTDTATFEFSAASGAGTSFRCGIDGQPFEACTSPESYTGLTAGAHTFTVEARTTLGNTATAARTFQFAIPDTTAPVVTATPTGGTFDAGQQITLSTDEPATIHFTTDGSTPTASSPQYTTPIVLSADFTLRSFAIDAAGNASAPAAQSYVVRTSPPPSGDPHDYHGDGNVDVIARNSSGALLLYPGNGTGGWLAARQIGSGWNAMAVIS